MQSVFVPGQVRSPQTLPYPGNAPEFERLPRLRI